MEIAEAERDVVPMWRWPHHGIPRVQKDADEVKGVWPTHPVSDIGWVLKHEDKCLGQGTISFKPYQDVGLSGQWLLILCRFTMCMNIAEDSIVIPSLKCAALKRAQSFSPNLYLP